MTSKSLGIVAFVALAALVSSCGGDAGGQDASLSSAQLSGSGGACTTATYGGVPYLFCTYQREWQEARAHCQAQGYDLVTITSAAENAFVRSHINDEVWIGATDAASEGTWRWIESGTQFWAGDEDGNPVGGAYRNWASSDPDGSPSDLDCGRMDDNSTGRWTAEECDDDNGYVCKLFADQCPDPGDPKVVPGQCGCGVPDIDTDDDGVADCVDGCPGDGDKTSPGDCGCGSPETDSDGDGTADCADECPSDPGATFLPCSPDTNCIQRTFNGVNYYFCNRERSWDAARQRCESIGYQLARIDDADEDAFIVDNLLGGDNWIGGSDLSSEGVWRWEIGEEQFWQGDDDGAPTGLYENWKSGQPNDLGGEDCLQIEHDGDWRDDDCADTEPYVCEEFIDECPDDPAKTRAGVCGCGTPETDADGDGVPACEDDCDFDPNRTVLGQCGCVGEPFPRAAGEACDDAFCPGAAPAVCDGAGSCGSSTLSECIPATEPPRGCQVRVQGGHAYLFCTGDLTPSDAEDYCEAAGMTLVRIDDAAEDAFVAQSLTETSWIGARDSAIEGDFRWVDGNTLFWQGTSMGTPVAGLFTNWTPGEPSAFGAGDDCVAYVVSGGSPTGWDDLDCGVSRGFVCEVVDQCPSDAGKDKPGYCGCGVPEDIVVIDGNDVVVCTDQCPDDPTKIAPGKCGCGMPESLCPLECPGNLSDPSSPVYGKLRAGRCGCDVPDVDLDGNGVLDCFERDSQCGTAAAPLAMGTACDDSICAQTCPVSTTCDGAGTCGDPSACAPSGGGNCFYRVFRDHVYWFCDGQRTRAEAQAICGQDGVSYLVSIDDEAENEFVQTQIVGDSWTGGNQATTPGTWTWANATCEDAEPFWDGGETGAAHRGSAYTDWETGAPAGGDYAVVSAAASPGAGTWRAQTGGTLGFVCEKPRPRTPLCGPPGPACLAEYFGVGSCGPIHEACVPEDQVIPELAGLSEAEALAAIENCHEACETGTQAECETACAAEGIEPPPPSSTCVDTAGSAEMNELCTIAMVEDADGVPVSPLQPLWYADPATGNPIECVNTADCTLRGDLPADAVCGFLRLCTREAGTPGLPQCPEPVEDGPDVAVALGGKTGTVRVCGQPSSDCLIAQSGDPVRCDTTPLMCETPDAVQEVDTIVFPQFPQGAPQPVCPDELFDLPPLPEPDLTEEYPSWEQPCGAGGCQGDEAGQNHPYCKYRPALDGEQNNAIDPDKNHALARNQNKPGSANIVDFEFDPRLDLDYRAKLGPLGVPDIGVTAGAGLVAKAIINPGKLPFDGDVELLNLTAHAKADRCSVSTAESRIRLFGHDFLPAGASLDYTIPDCEEAFETFETYANRASKSMRDVASLLKQYQSAKDLGRRLDLSSLCALGGVLDDPPEGFPLPLNCADQPPESHINELIGYYEQQVVDLLASGVQLAENALTIRSPNPIPLFDVAGGDEEITLFTANFFVGPIPVTLEAFVAASYSIGLTADYWIQPGKAVSALLLPNAQTGRDHELLGVSVSGGPRAQAFLGFFAGAGFSFGPVGASIGIEARLSLGAISLTVDGGAGLIMTGQPDPRPLGSDLQNLVLAGSRPLIEPMVYKLKLGYSAGLSADIRDILSGEVNARLRLKFFWFSKTYRQRLLRFNGFCTDPSDLENFPCHIPILELGASTTLADLPWATIRMSQLLPKLQLLPFVPEPDPATPEVKQAVDMTHLEELFFERLCSCVAPGDTCSSNGDCCNDLQCADDGTGATTCGCRAAGESCAADADCCSGQPCVGGACQCTAQSESCQSDGECCGGLGCNAVPGGGRCGCSAYGDVCADDSDCCDGPCQGGECGVTPI